MTDLSSYAADVDALCRRNRTTVAEFAEMDDDDREDLIAAELVRAWRAATDSGDDAGTRDAAQRLGTYIATVLDGEPIEDYTGLVVLLDGKGGLRSFYTREV